MRITWLITILITALGAWAATPALQAPLAADATAARAQLAKMRAAGRCYLADLSHGDTGALVQGSSETPLPAGRYRLHALLALAPLGNVSISAIAITIQAGGEKRVVTMPYFPVADEFVDLPLDFTAAGHTASIGVTWAITGELAKKNRMLALEAPKDPGADADADDLESYKQDDDGMIAVAELSKIKYHLAGCGFVLEPLSPLQVTKVETDKIVDKPGDKGAASAVITNAGAAPVTAKLTVEVLTGLDSRRPVYTGTLELAPGASQPWSGAFDTAGLYWGAELRVSARVGDGPEATGRATFAAADNFWETSIASGMMFSHDYIKLPDAERFTQNMKDNGYTIFESGFWAPDEFGDFTPDQDTFFGGQGCYPGSVTGTRNVINEAHKRGIASTVYSNLWGGDGWESYEMMRKHPDWFSPWGGACSDQMENWHLMFKYKVLMHVWPYTCVNLTLPETLAVHATELVNSHRTIGWDGVRYDSYDAEGEWNITATDKVRKLVEKEEPNYRWGYNSSVPSGATPHNLEVMCRGGQLVMEEGARHIGQLGGGSLAEYADRLAGFRDKVWLHAGQLAVCYDAPSALHGGNVLDSIYINAALLACGCHPYYSCMEREFGNFPGFALRYSAILWDNHLQPLKMPEAVISIGGDPKLIEWKRLARRLDLGGDRHRLIVHLLNPPAVDHTEQNPALKTTPPLRNLPVTVNLPPGAHATGGWALDAIPTPRHTVLSPTAQGDRVTLTVPEVRFWTVVVLEYTVQEGR